MTSVTQDVILLCNIFEHRFIIMQEMYVLNPRHCNSAITLGGCIEKNKSKVITTFPTSPDVVQLFQKTLIGSFSWVNTGLALDTEILLPNLSSKDF